MVDEIIGEIGKFGYISRVDKKNYTEYFFPNEGFHRSLKPQIVNREDSFICYGGSTTPLVSHVADCTLISHRNLLEIDSPLMPKSSLKVINPDKSKRDVAISKLVEILS